MNSVVQGGGIFERPNIRSVGNGALVQRLLLLTVLVAFGTGCVVGSMFSAGAIADKMREATINPQRHSVDVFEQLNRQLSITPAQYSTVQDIVQRHFENSNTIRQANLPVVLAEFDRFELELAGVLNEEQNQSWKKQADWIRQNCYGVDTSNALAD